MDSPPRPRALPLIGTQIPADLRALNRWVCWSYTLRGKGWTKVPVTPRGRAASSTDPATWSAFHPCEMNCVLSLCDGVGLVLGEDLQGIDLDDCRELGTEKLSPLAQEILARVNAYAEVSPSGTGIKLFGRFGFARSHVKPGLELYAAGRYFAVTGQSLPGHTDLVEEPQDLSWLIAREFGASAVSSRTESQEERRFEAYRAPLEGWPLERVTAEVLPHLDPGCGYFEWISIGSAMHHQGQGDPAWLEAWDDWSSSSSKWAAGVCAQKWKSFSVQRGNGVVTLASLIKQTAASRSTALALTRASHMDALQQEIAACTDERALQSVIAKRVAKDRSLIDIEREQIATAIQARARDLGVRLPIAIVRQWLRPRDAGEGFAHMSDDGYPLCTIENLQALLDRLGYVVRYNCIKKSSEILIPGASFSRDNRDNAAIASILSECERVRMPTRHVTQYLYQISDRNLYNPVATWIESRPWDGVSRLEAFYATIQAVGADDLKRVLLRKWLLQAVAAAFAPDGIAGQGILTLVGPQGVGKTTWFQRLAPADLDVVLTGHTIDLRSKDSVLTALSYWIVELGEVDATMRKSDISALKSFVTQPVDKIRKPYAATDSCFGRRTVFGATLNDSVFLHDPTGNRRFWTLEVESFAFDHAIDMQQLWAEVLLLYQTGEHFALDGSELQALSVHNEDYTAQDPVEERLLTGLDWDGHREWEWKTATEILMSVGFKEPHKLQTTTASRVLRRANGNRRRRSHGRTVFYVPKPALDF